MLISILTDGSIMTVLSIIVLIVLLWIILRFRAKKNPVESSLDLLKKRLEKGEITEKEYE